MIHLSRLPSLTDIENGFHLRVMGLDFHIDGFHRIHFNLTDYKFKSCLQLDDVLSSSNASYSNGHHITGISHKWRVNSIPSHTYLLHSNTPTYPVGGD